MAKIMKRGHQMATAPSSILIILSLFFSLNLFADYGGCRVTMMYGNGTWYGYEDSFVAYGPDACIKAYKICEYQARIQRKVAICVEDNREPPREEQPAPSPHFLSSARSICNGIVYDDPTNTHTCDELSGAARSVCYGLEYSRSTNTHTCNELSINGNAFCLGAVYADPAYSHTCDELSGDARSVCYGLEYARSGNVNSCSKLSGHARNVCYAMVYSLPTNTHTCGELN